MKLSRTLLAHSAIAVIAIAGYAAARQQTGGGQGGAGGDAAPAQPDITEYLPHLRNMDPNAAMQRVMASMQPGKPHEFLAKLAGEWDVTMRMWGDGADQPPMESKGSASARMILGGRFLQYDTKCEIMGMTMEGTGLTGFSNDRNLFVGSWANNMSTDLIPLAGSLDREGKVLTLIGLMNEPATGELAKPAKFVYRITGPDSYSFEAWEIIHGDEWKVVESVHTRMK